MLKLITSFLKPHCLCSSCFYYFCTDYLQDSKLHKGELFGISNLFRDLLETIFTSEIIEKHDERTNGTQRPNPGYNLLSKSTQPELTDEQAMSSKYIVRLEEAEGGDISGLDNAHGSRGELEDDIEDNETSAQSEVQSTSIDEIENDSQSQYDHMLKDAGKQLIPFGVSRVIWLMLGSRLTWKMLLGSTQGPLNCYLSITWFTCLGSMLSGAHYRTATGNHMITQYYIYS